MMEENVMIQQNKFFWTAFSPCEIHKCEAIEDSKGQAI